LILGKSKKKKKNISLMQSNGSNVLLTHMIGNEQAPEVHQGRSQSHQAAHGSG
jgi:hypothetical protein